MLIIQREMTVPPCIESNDLKVGELGRTWNEGIVVWFGLILRQLAVCHFRGGTEENYGKACRVCP